MNNPYISLLRAAWKYARHEKKLFLCIYIMFLGANIIAAIGPWWYGQAIDHIQKNKDKVLHYAFLYAAGVIVLKFLEWSLHGPARVMERSLAFRMSRNFLKERYHQVMHLPAKWQQEHHSGATINRVKKGYDSLREFFDRGFLFMQAICKCLFSMGAIVFFSPLYGSIAVALGVFTVSMIMRFDKPFVKALEEVNEREHTVSSTLFDTLSNIMTVITLRLEKSMETGLLSKVALIYKPFRRSAVINEWKWFVTDMMITLMYSIVVVGYIYQHWNPGSIFLIGGLVMLIGYVNQFTSVFQNVAWLYTDLIQYNTNVDTSNLIDKAYKEQHRADSPGSLRPDWKVLKLDRLTFSHRNNYTEGYAPQSLHQLSIRINRGEKIALIGESGSGKSTLLALLRGLYLPEPGLAFTIDGQEASLDILNESITLFPQEPEIFENTIAYNITLGLPFSDEEILEVCKVAHFDTVVHQLPEGLLSDIREKGVNLSGGQKQRLALARGVLAAKDSAVILLDEPTSSVDPKTEALIYEELFKAFQRKAVISSIHRLHLLSRFDYVYILSQGRVVDEGTFSDLLHRSQVFQDLWVHQKSATANS
jgi:ATP-binding cassette subfamily B protein